MVKVMVMAMAAGPWLWVLSALVALQVVRAVVPALVEAVVPVVPWTVLDVVSR